MGRAIQSMALGRHCKSWKECRSIGSKFNVADVCFLLILKSVCTIPPCISNIIVLRVKYLHEQRIAKIQWSLNLWMLLTIVANKSTTHNNIPLTNFGLTTILSKCYDSSFPYQIQRKCQGWYFNLLFLLNTITNTLFNK